MPPHYLDNHRQYPSFDPRHHWAQQSHNSNANEPNRFGPYYSQGHYYYRGGNARGLGLSLPYSMSSGAAQIDHAASQQYTPMQPIQYGPLQPGNASAYECHCADCTHLAETGWSSYIDQNAFAPFPSQQAATLQAQSQYNFRDRYGYPPANPLWHGQQTIPGRLPSIDGAGMVYDPLPSTVLPEPSMALIAPRDIFANPSPVPALSDCSTCSTNNSVSSTTFAGDTHSWQPYASAITGDPWSVKRSTDGWSNILQGGRDIREPTGSPSEYYSTTDVDDSSRYSPTAQGPNEVPAHQRRVSTTSGSQGDVELNTLEERDDLLVQWKLDGMSYKEIKAKGKFKEAESTLRGRFRALTKDPKQRVRKPHWTRRDIKLLREAVDKLSVPAPSYQMTPSRIRSRSSSPTNRVSKASHRQQVVKPKTSWKEVADYIIEHGGSYRFGNATCRKKFDEIEEGDEEHAE